MFKNYGTRTALVDEIYGEITYQELHQEAEELYARIRKRCLVFSLCRNSVESVVGYVSFLNHRIVPLLLSEGLDESLVETLLEIYRPEYVWCHCSRAEKLDGYKSIYQQRDYVLLETGSESCPLYDELALLLTTSGSTGSPKLVRQSYQNIRSNTESIVQYLELNQTERAITTLPMNYTYGLSVLTTHLYVGATVLLTEKAVLQKEFWTFFKDQAATSVAGVPYTYEMLDKLRFVRMDLPSLRYMTQAGGKLSPELHKKFAEYAVKEGKKFIVMYGQTEATARMAYLPYERSLEKYGSMGIAIPGGRFELIDADETVIEESGKTGELVYYGENVTLGYAEKRDDLSLGDERHGRLVTGDMAQKDEDGFYYIVGRKKRFLKIFGSRINLDEMERMIKREYSDMDCACAGHDDHMYIFITDPSRVQEVRRYAAEKTGMNGSAFSVKAIEQIPKNEAGKILYKALEEFR